MLHIIENVAQILLCATSAVNQQNAIQCLDMQQKVKK
jgi:hypothetical protein